ncbi:MAG: glycosyltransferase [bacterium]|nr:glycosyltransferase [bacterium]
MKSNFYSKWKYNHHQINKIICVSKTVEDIVAQNLEYPEKITTIYSGIKLNRFENSVNEETLRSKYQLNQDSILIGNTSALADQKDYFTFLRVAKNVINETESAYFFLVGEGKLKGEILSKIDSYGLQKRIFITGRLNNIPSVLKELNIFLMTSKTEGLGTSVLDAFASKLPVVSTNAGGLKELVKHYETGLIADVGDDIELAKHVMAFIKQGDLKSKVVTNAYEYVKSFSSKKTATQTLEVYKSILRE